MAQVTACPNGEQLKRIALGDPALADGDALIEHIAEEPLVSWAWSPGYGRQPVPGTQKQAAELVEAWVKTGAACPN